MKDHINKKCLITTSGWFVAPDGKEYRAVWGELKAIHEVGKSLGFIPNRSHANWFVEIGGMIVMGCQVMYFVACPEMPETGEVEHWNTKEAGGIDRHLTPSKIYISQ